MSYIPDCTTSDWYKNQRQGCVLRFQGRASSSEDAQLIIGHKGSLMRGHNLPTKKARDIKTRLQDKLKKKKESK